MLQKDYVVLFNAISNAVDALSAVSDALKQAQMDAEEIAISSTPELVVLSGK